MIYLAKCGDYYKIGFTSGDVSKRISALQTGNPIPIQLVGTIPGDQKTETALHVRFSEKRVQGEWFTLDDDDVRNMLSSQKPFAELTTEEKLSRMLEKGREYPEQFIQFVKEVRKMWGQ